MDGLEYRVISEKESNDLERTPHNPPSYSEAFTPDDFSSEWWSVRSALKERLEIFGDEWLLSTGKGDFMLSESRGNSRWVYITFVSTRLWCLEFPIAVADLLRSLPHEYRVACLTDLEDDFLEHPLVYLVISASSVLGRADYSDYDALTEKDCQDTLKRFGFPARAIQTAA